MSEEPIELRAELQRLHDQAAATVAVLEESKRAIEAQLEAARSVLKRIKEKIHAAEK